MDDLKEHLLQQAKSVKEGQSIEASKGREEKAFDELIEEGHISARKVDGAGENTVEYVDIST
ncbi:hypothetical protein [Marinococcus halotolerans]|uniref:hypothetical protein n=1 Tax=Marinococcus halotolerans TaxID=301092 RepID=UPI0003B3EA1F|nr:hypothetical protein [Marinococcus halotolerans]